MALISDISKWYLQKFELPIEITADNNGIEIDLGGGGITRTITVGIYKNLSAILTALTTLWTDGSITFAQNATTKLVTITKPSGTMTIAEDDNLLDLLGFTQASYSGLLSYTAENQSNLFWIPDICYSPETALKTDNQQGFVQVSDSGDFVLETSANILQEFELLYYGLPAEIEAWYTSFRSLYSQGLLYYPTQTTFAGGAVTPEFCVFNEESMRKYTRKYIDIAQSKYYQIRFGLIKTNAITYDFS